MNQKLLLPLACSAALTAGWIAGYAMGEKSAPPASASGDSNSLAPPTSANAPRDLPPAPAAEKQNEQTLFGALRAPDSLRRTRDMADAILKMSPGEIASAIALAQRLPHKDRYELLPLLVRRWAETDPRAAVKFALSLGRDLRESSIIAASQVWTSADPKTAEEWVQSLPPGGGTGKSEALFGVMSTLMKSDPASALRLLQSRPTDGFNDWTFGNVFAVWAAHDRPAAARQALALPAGQNRDQAIREVVNEWTETDPQAALAWVAQLPESGARRDALGSAYTRWAERDPKAASAAVLAMPAGEERHRALDDILNAVSGSDPQTAATLAVQMPTGAARDRAIFDIATALARVDVADALRWAGQLPDGDSKKGAQQNILTRWAFNDPRAAIDYFMKSDLASAPEGENTLRQIARVWSHNDSPHALAWARQIADENLRGNVLSGVIETMSDPQQAAGLLAELPAASQPAIAGELATTWMRNDPDGAAAWALQLPEGDAKTHAVSNVVSQKAQQDLAKAASWLEKLTAGASRDAAVREFTQRAVGSDPEGAATWAATIGDAKMRATELERVAGQWLGQDKAAAAQWITRSPAFDDATKQRLLRGK